MASGMYENGVAALMGGDIDFLNDTISVVLVSAAYDVDLETDVSQSDIPEAAQIAERQLQGKSIDGTTFTADSLTFPSVTGSTVVAVVILRDDGTQQGSRLIAYLDNAPGLPVTPDGTDITLNWDASLGIVTL